MPYFLYENTLLLLLLLLLLFLDPKKAFQNIDIPSNKIKSNAYIIALFPQNNFSKTFAIGICPDLFQITVITTVHVKESDLGSWNYNTSRNNM